MLINLATFILFTLIGIVAGIGLIVIGFHIIGRCKQWKI